MSIRDEIDSYFYELYTKNKWYRLWWDWTMSTRLRKWYVRRRLISDYIKLGIPKAKAIEQVDKLRSNI